MAAGVGWSLCSVGMSFANKVAVVSTGAPLALTALQMLVTALLAWSTCDLHFGKGTFMWTAIVSPLFVLMCVHNPIKTRLYLAIQSS